MPFLLNCFHVIIISKISTYQFELHLGTELQIVVLNARDQTVQEFTLVVV